MIKTKRGLEIPLASGHRVYVDLFVLEGELADIDITTLNPIEIPLLYRRRNMDGYDKAWFDMGPTHEILPEPFPDEADPIERVLVSVLLWSEPVSEEFAFSELGVVLFVEWKEVLDLAGFLQKSLRDLDWNGLAVDRCPRRPTPDEVGASFSSGSVNEE